MQGWRSKGQKAGRKGGGPGPDSTLTTAPATGVLPRKRKCHPPSPLPALLASVRVSQRPSVKGKFPANNEATLVLNS